MNDLYISGNVDVFRIFLNNYFLLSDQDACTITACTMLARLGAPKPRKPKHVHCTGERCPSPFTGCGDSPLKGVFHLPIKD